MDILTQLKEQTKQKHLEVEANSGISKIFDHSITVKEYQDILQNNYNAYYNTESAISSYFPIESIATWIFNDLEKPTSSNLEFQLDNNYQALGAQYVIEGSLLGSAYIAKEIGNCHNLNSLKPQSFYTRPDKSRINRWSTFKKQMQDQSFTKQQTEDIIAGANKTFDLFNTVFTNKVVI